MREFSTDAAITGQGCSMLLAAAEMQLKVSAFAQIIINEAYLEA